MFKGIVFIDVFNFGFFEILCYFMPLLCLIYSAFNLIPNKTINYLCIVFSVYNQFIIKL